MKHLIGLNGLETMVLVIIISAIAFLILVGIIVAVDELVKKIKELRQSNVDHKRLRLRLDDDVEFGRKR